VNAVTGGVITRVAAGTAADIEIAAQAAKKAYKERWGLKVPGAVRGNMLKKLADLLEANIDEFAALEALDVGTAIPSYISFSCRNYYLGKAFNMARFEIPACVAVLRYYSGWADKIQGKTLEVGTTWHIHLLPINLTAHYRRTKPS